ncbi:hypothetical protein [Streptomyces sp. XY413]|uniref:hypothetical protein n=1 Tax=Streptomyces sp. XY413 TaxID=1519479 RepID=UPI0018FE95C8|nr:hypothetical protein [Streptomyces sp. XY413]
MSLEQEPADEHRAQILAAALAARAGVDAGFAAALNAWHEQARQVVPTSHSGNVSAHISGGSQGTVVTTRDVAGGLYLGPQASPPAQPEQPSESGS